MEIIYKTINKGFKKIGIVLVYVYRLIIRPLFPSACRFHPTCSEYTIQAIQKYGLFKGGGEIGNNI
jgi:putative membrane protein insertion efficiency factor